MATIVEQQPLPQQEMTDFPRRRAGSAAISFFVYLGITLLFVASNPGAFLHWFVLPVTLCGIIIGIDAVDWLRSRVDVFDPIGIIGLLGFHFFYMAPLLHVSWDYWMRYIIPPADWRPWLGGMAVLNLLGLLVYRFFRGPALRISRRATRRTVWQVNEKLFPTVLAFALLITGGLQILVYQQYGGIGGYIAAYEVRYTAGSFAGMGWIFMISESFPILAFMGYAFWARRRPAARSWAALILALILFGGLQLLFGGLRGSRSNTIWALFWAVGIIHFWLRPVSKAVIYSGAIFLFVFMYVYGFYKAVGADAFQIFQNPELRFELEEKSGRTVQGVLLGDLGRSDVQAFLLYRITGPGSDYEYAWGRTYLGAAVLLIPESIWPDRPINKVKEGTEAQYGAGSYIPGVRVSSRVYGLAGETMLNFSPLLVPLAFTILGVAVKTVRRGLATWDRNDTRMLLIPFLINFCFMLLNSDSDNLVFFLIKNGAVPFLVILLGSTIMQREEIDQQPDIPG